MTDYKEENVWGECVADFRTFLAEEPELSFRQFIST